RVRRTGRGSRYLVQLEAGRRHGRTPVPQPGPAVGREAHAGEPASTPCGDPMNNRYLDHQATGIDLDGCQRVSRTASTAPPAGPTQGVHTGKALSIGSAEPMLRAVRCSGRSGYLPTRAPRRLSHLSDKGLPAVRCEFRENERDSITLSSNPHEPAT